MNSKTEPVVKAESTTKRELLTSPSPPGRCSCGRLCDHAPSSIPDMKPVAETEQPFVASFLALEIVDLISDDETDVDFPSPLTRKGKERMRAQQNTPLIVIKDNDDEEELPSTGGLLKRARSHIPAAATSSKGKTLLTAFNHGTNSSSSSSSRQAVSHQAAPTSRRAGSTNNLAKIATSSAVARATPQWPTQKNIPQWLRNLKGVYNVNPNQFYPHIDTWFDELETKM
ncbi:hypothetical protein CEP54_006014 [Fusarium duplospermum]|uniref:Uncharacterized protein n=1 Tax=Fusarium duplospermum TaxID=1325734 RepID=A0A428Q9D5_9HYPO|nr:hypothetical protein CEP54_006014 [Fusarium duplospermum]